MTQLSASQEWIGRAIRAVTSSARNRIVFYIEQGFVVSGNHCIVEL